MPGVDRFGRLKKNPLLGQSFGRGAGAEERRAAYTGLHGELKRHVTSGGQGSLAQVARKRFRNWGDPRAAEIQRHQGEAAGLESQLRDWSIQAGISRNDITDMRGRARWQDVTGRDSTELRGKMAKAEMARKGMLGDMQRGQAALSGHQAALRSGRGAYQARQGLYNRFFGRSSY